MIEIRNSDGLTLELATGARLSVELASGLMADENVPGGFSYPLDFPLSPDNRQFLGHLYRPDAYQPRMELPVSVRIEGFLFRRCTLSYRIENNRGSGYLKIDSGEIADRLRSQKLSEVMTDRILFPAALGTMVGSLAYQYAQAKPGTYPFTFFPVYNPGFMPDVTTFSASNLAGYKKSEYVNLVVKSGSGFTFETDRINKFGSHLVPFFYLTWVLERLFTRLGYRIEGPWLADPETHQLVVYNTAPMRSASHLTGPFFVNAYQHLPDLTVNDFLKGIRQMLGLSFLFDANQRVCTIRCFPQIRSDRDVQDLAPYQLAGFAIAPAGGQGFSVSEYQDSGDALYAEREKLFGATKPKRITSGAQAIELTAGTLPMVEYIHPVWGIPWTVPSANQPGNLYDYQYTACSDRWSDDPKTPKNPFGLRLLRYRGIQQASGSNYYPLGSSGVRGHLGDLLGRQALTLNGSFGLWETALKQYYFFRDQTRPLTTQALLPVSVLASLDLAGKIGLRLADGAWKEYLIGKVSVEAPATAGLVEAEIEALTLPAKDLTTGDDYLSSVWVALEYKNRRTTKAEAAGNVLNPFPTVVTNSIADQYLTVWADKEKTRPLPVSGLTVQVKVIAQNLFLSGLNLYNVNTYTINGTELMTAAGGGLAAHVVKKSDGSLVFDMTTGYTILPSSTYNVLD